MEDHIQLGYLLDAYGELLTTHQRNILSQSLDEDLSLAEIAQREGITRQGVRDTIKRASEQLMYWETHLKIVEKNAAIRREIRELRLLAESIGPDEIKEQFQAHIRALNDILEDEHGI